MKIVIEGTRQEKDELARKCLMSEAFKRCGGCVFGPGEDCPGIGKLADIKAAEETP